AATAPKYFLVNLDEQQLHTPARSTLP
ncbi:unnamed protein product, partial [Rotaria sp. Silwood1]